MLLTGHCFRPIPSPPLLLPSWARRTSFTGLATGGVRLWRRGEPGLTATAAATPFMTTMRIATLYRNCIGGQAELRMSESSARSDDLSDGPFRACVSKVCSHKGRFPQIGPAEVRIVHIGVDEDRELQVRVFEVGAVQVGVGELHAA